MGAFREALHARRTPTTPLTHLDATTLAIRYKNLVCSVRVTLFEVVSNLMVRRRECTAHQDDRQAPKTFCAPRGRDICFLCWSIGCRAAARGGRCQSPRPQCAYDRVVLSSCETRPRTDSGDSRRSQPHRRDSARSPLGKRSASIPGGIWTSWPRVTAFRFRTCIGFRPARTACAIPYG